MLLVLLLGCSAYEKLFELLEDPPAPPCEERGAWWEDLDGDGVGGSAEVWVSCEQPAGWVATGGDCDDADPAVTTGCVDTGDTSDTSDSGDTADTADSGDTSGSGDTSDTSDTADTADTADTSDASDTSDTSAAADTSAAPDGPELR